MKIRAYEVTIKVQCPKRDKHNGFFGVGRHFEPGKSEHTVLVLRQEDIKEFAKKNPAKVGELLKQAEAVPEFHLVRLLNSSEVAAEIVRKRKVDDVQFAEQPKQQQASIFDDDDEPGSQPQKQPQHQGGQQQQHNRK